MTPYIPREIHTAVAPALSTMPIVVITGMRQTGKTTFLQNDPLFKKYQYVSLDDFATLQTAQSQPGSLLAAAERLCIDEAQKAPDLLTAVKRAVDRDRTPGRFVLSGSANFALLKGISESLAGRAIYFVLQPLSCREMKSALNKEPFLVRALGGDIDLSGNATAALRAAEILRGGMPAVRSLSPEAAAVWFRGFEQTYVERDIREIARIDDILSFRSVIKLAALRTGQILNMSQLARDARLSQITTTRYVQLAETSFLLRRLPPFLRNRSSRLIKSPKLYATDSGLACHLAGIEHLDSDEPMRGVLFETYALQNIAAILEAHAPEARISYWHIQGRREVDFVIEHKKHCVAIEVKAAGRWSESDLASLKVFLENTPSCRAAILAYNGTQSAQLGKKLWAVPLGTLLS
jgi:hypothetical protein